MTVILTSILCLVIAVYVAAAWIVCLTLSEEPDRCSPVVHGDLPTVAVVVAARNEEEHLGACLQSLINQLYPSDRVEFVIVDDHSSDGTARVIEEFAQQDPRISRVESAAHDTHRGKAFALDLGIATTSADIIATTDADCWPPADWLRGMVRGLISHGAAALGGPTRIVASTPFERLQALDWLLGFGVAGALSELGYPITAMGNNMAFRRRDYDAVGGYGRFVGSPTEDYALFRALADRPGGVRLSLEAGLITYTKPAVSLGQVISQRRRWARGGLRAPAWANAFYAVAWLTSLLPIIALPLLPVVAIACLFLKTAADAYVVKCAAHRLGVEVGWIDVPLFEAFFVGYVSFLPFSLAAAPKLTWKGRSL